MFTDPEHRYMARALQLARRGLYTTDPNPRVGCVVARGERIVGEAWHERTGEPHAEVNALRHAGGAARGASVYVTLEPCCHQGRTGACTEALVAAGVSEVVAAMPDPNPQVGGRGLETLRRAGLRVRSGLMQAEAEALNPGFISRMRRGRPFVRVKLAASLDGRTALASGASRWITGAAARADVHRLRARSSAILTGIGTVLADDPSLTVRLEGSPAAHRQPLRVVADGRLELPLNAKMLGLPGRTLVACAGADAGREADLAGAGAEIVTLPGSEGRVELTALMRHLATEEVNELLVESGPTLSGALLRAGLVDELVLYLAPTLLGDGARGLFHLPEIERMDQQLGLDIVDWRALGPDWRITARIRSDDEDAAGRHGT
ncbi:MAG: bifunctional diaminohydroxyphosphoribosylaminopyrimidine deaminase/5-amino-6-(5-phosphoribosylamino)uracil reductase RibD [Gammaproteobacteria bacterium]|nr:bifunctional diaminohydroxyphosphoribosylaminopyrimidine deaminase/5-amino-6-(5-phosphoribosylamino)uracil reductase RibD [Gammaproteobacteria bacterium]NIR82339.1 bifunctional diaminohydroxyphosphoribosylaminopyrimidine deaminase/5-amino-6-(5-phosphoribosylamino)uracil reductase RibD [Gammaproteobacteria bacterium]NIR91838.1 bifunctional diaminohydroxyphosphoribosylaminopyrimidine deaminase/5-amino-6-(5-phosphoribosylamino)uracil reductase RibD [Gammaproteobacteria bacterium]NIU03489.1 bifun